MHVCFAELANHLIEFGSSFSVLGESEAEAVGVALSRFGAVAARLAASTTIHVSSFANPRMGIFARV